MTAHARLDGNAIAGALHEVLGAEMTTVPRTCPSCRACNPVGAYHVYRSAGIVLRCPACGTVALTLAGFSDRYVVRLTGTWTLDVPRT